MADVEAFLVADLAAVSGVALEAGLAVVLEGAWEAAPATGCMHKHRGG